MNGTSLAEEYISGKRTRSDLLAFVNRKENEILSPMLHCFLARWIRMDALEKGRVSGLVSEMLLTYSITNDDDINGSLLALVILAEADRSIAEHIDRLSVKDAMSLCAASAPIAGEKLVPVLRDLLARALVAYVGPAKPTIEMPKLLPITEPAFVRSKAPALPEKLRQGVATTVVVPDDPRELLIYLRKVGRAPRLDQVGRLDIPFYSYTGEETGRLHKHRAAITELLQEEATNPNFRLTPAGRDATEPGRSRRATSASLPAPSPRGEGLAARIMDHLRKHQGQEVPVATLRAMVNSPAAVAQGKEQAWLSSCIASLIRKDRPITVVWDGSERHKGYILKGEGRK